MSKKIYLVETISMFRMRYAVLAEEESHAMDEVVCRSDDNCDFVEFSQHHIDEVISSSRELTKDEYLQLFDKDNNYLSCWTDEQKLEFINVIDYTK